MYTPIFSLLKRTNKENSPIAGPYTENIYTTYFTCEIDHPKYRGVKFLYRQIRNDYVIISSCQWGVQDSQRIAAELGLAL